MKRIRRPWRKFYGAISELLVFSPSGFWGFKSDPSVWSSVLRRSCNATRISNPQARLLMLEQERGLDEMMDVLYVQARTITEQPTTCLTRKQMGRIFPESQFCIVSEKGEWVVKKVGL